MRDKYGRFAAGESGNPAGRPADANAARLRRLARTLTLHQAEQLVAIACDDDKPAGLRVLAATLFLDAEKKRPRKGGAAVELSDAELLALLLAEADRLDAADEECADNPDLFPVIRRSGALRAFVGSLKTWQCGPMVARASLRCRRLAHPAGEATHGLPTRGGTHGETSQ